MEKEIKAMEALIGIEYEKITINRYWNCYRCLKACVQSFYEKEDIVFPELSRDFIIYVERHMRLEKRLCQNTLVRYMKCFKKFVNMGLLRQDKDTPKDIIDAIRQLLYSHGLTEITFPEEQDDPVWVIWFDNNADPFECKVTGIQVTDNSMTVIAHEKEANFEATCHTPFELGASNIDWLQQMYDAV